MRYYDLEQRCYVVTGGQPDHSRNVTRFAGARPCAGQSHCVRIDATRYGDASDGVHVAKLGRSVAGKCSGLAAGELQQCFVRLVSITPQSGLFVQFQAAYEREIRK